MPTPEEAAQSIIAELPAEANVGVDLIANRIRKLMAEDDLSVAAATEQLRTEISNSGQSTARHSGPETTPTSTDPSIKESPRSGSNDDQSPPSDSAENPRPICSLDATLDGEWFSICGTVQERFELTQNQQGVLAQKGRLVDDTGSIVFTVFQDDVDQSSRLPLQQGRTYRLNSVVGDTFRESLQVTIRPQTEVEPLEASPDQFLSHDGWIVAVHDRSGLAQKCPVDDCHRLVDETPCPVHDTTDGDLYLQMVAWLDDGVAPKEIYLNAEQTRDLVGMSLAEAKKIARENRDLSDVTAKVRQRALGTPVSVTGRYTGRLFNVSDLRAYDSRIETEAREVHREISKGKFTPLSRERRPFDPHLWTYHDLRNPAVRVFTPELSEATEQRQMGTDSLDPVYTVLPTGQLANRVLIAGAITRSTLTEYEGTQVVRATLSDGIDTVPLSASAEYHPRVADRIRRLDPPTHVLVMGKPTSYTDDHGETRIEIGHPELVAPLSESERRRWIVDAGRATCDRLGRYYCSRESRQSPVPTGAQIAAAQYPDSPDQYVKRVPDLVSQTVL